MPRLQLRTPTNVKGLIRPSMDDSERSEESRTATYVRSLRPFHKSRAH